MLKYVYVNVNVKILIQPQLRSEDIKIVNHTHTHKIKTQKNQNTKPAGEQGREKKALIQKNTLPHSHFCWWGKKYKPQILCAALLPCNR